MPDIDVMDLSPAPPLPSAVVDVTLERAAIFAFVAAAIAGIAWAPLWIIAAAALVTIVIANR